MAAYGNQGARNIHLIGIGGIGMSGLARILKAKGYSVSGTDLCVSNMTDSLQRLGIDVKLGHNGANLPAGTALVVRTAAVGDGNSEVAAARERRIRVARYSEVLGALMREKIGIAVAGTHGKTTTTSMVAHIISKAGFDPSYVIGGIAKDLGGNSGMGYGVHFVAEACEYAASFLDLCPEIAVITNMEPDHLDYYGTFAAVRKSFEAFISKLPPHGTLVANAEDIDVMSAVVNAAVCRVMTFGITAPAGLRATTVGDKRGRYSFSMEMDGRPIGKVRLLVPGYHNVKNALAAAAAALAAGASPADVSRGLSTFTGVERRFQVVGRSRGVTVVNDYSHHPTELRALLATARKSWPDSRICCVFQPHQGSRTRYLMEDFARAFTGVETVYVPEIYYVRDASDEPAVVSSRNLVGRMKDIGIDAHFVKSLEEVRRIVVARASRGDVIIFAGAGPVGDLPASVLVDLENSASRRMPAKAQLLPSMPALSPEAAVRDREPVAGGCR